MTKARLEQRVLQSELDIRELKYSIQQRDETIKVNNVLQEQLRDDIKKLEGRLAHEVKCRETAELKVREYELEDRTKTVSVQQKREQKENHDTNTEKLEFKKKFKSAASVLKQEKVALKSTGKLMVLIYCDYCCMKIAIVL